MKKGLFSILSLLLTLTFYAQSNNGLNWITGSGNSYKINFKNQQTFINVFDTNYNFYFSIGTSCISDDNEKFEVLCNGYFLYDTLGNIIDGGDTITPKKICDWESGYSVFSQASIILPFANHIYYVITPTASDSIFTNGWQGALQSDYFDLLLIHKVDMKLNGGAGKVIKKAVPLLKDLALSRTQMMACRHADGKNWWLVKQARDTNMVYKFIITEDTVFNMGVQGFPEPHWKNVDIEGQTMFSQDGKKYATLAYGLNKVFIANFNRCDGIISDGRIYTLPINNRAPSIPTLDTSCTGVCFSPDGNFIYVSKDYNLYQLDLSDTNALTQWYHVANMDTTYAEFQQWVTIYPSVDNKLYIGNWNGLGNAMSVIDNPNIKGIGCSFCPKCLKFNKIGIHAPPCMPNYGLGADSALLIGCAPVSIPNNPPLVASDFSVYPNPTCQTLYFQNANGKTKLVVNALGQIIISTTKDEIDVSALAKGLYFIHCNNKTKKVLIE